MSAPGAISFRSWAVRRWLACLLLVVGCVFVYWQVPEAGFVSFDDDANFVRNEMLGPLSLTRLDWILTEHQVMMRYVPMGWLLCSALTGTGGLDPFWFHLAALCLHAGACVLFYLILERMAGLLELRLGDGQAEGGRTPATAAWGRGRALPLLPLLIAAWWGWHPLRVETVAWATALLYVEASFLGLMAFWLHLRELECTGARALVLRVGSLLLLCAALLSHPAALCLLPLQVALEPLLRPPPGEGPGLWRDRAWQGRALLRLLPGLLAGLACLAVALVVRQMEALSTYEGTPSLAQFGLGERLAQGCAVLVHFLEKTLWPAGLCPVYPLLERVDPLAPRFVISMVIALGVLLLGLRLLRSSPLPGLLALGTLASCLPVLGLQEHPYFPCDRYTHVPSLLLGCLLLAWCLREKDGAKARGLATSLVLVSCLCAWLPLARLQTQIWRNDDSLTAALMRGQRSDNGKEKHLARNLLLQIEKGELEQSRELLSHLNEKGPLSPRMRAVALELSKAEAPGWTAPLAQLLHAQALMAVRRGEAEMAEDRFRRALGLSPGYTQARYNYCLTLCTHGRTAEALAQLNWLRAHPGELTEAKLTLLRSLLTTAYRSTGQEKLARRLEAGGRVNVGP